MTVECWAKVDGQKDAAPILLSNEPRHSATHWELAAKPTSGAFAVSLPGYEPAEIASDRDVADGKWHHLGFVFEGNSAGLFVDGQEVARQDLKKVKPYPDSGRPTVGRIPGVPSNTGRADRRGANLPRRPAAGNRQGADAPYRLTPTRSRAVALRRRRPGRKDVPFPDSSPTRNAGPALPRDLRPPRRRRVRRQPTWLTAGPAGATWNTGRSSPRRCSCPSQKQNVTYKAVSIRLGKEKKYAVAFDTELLRMSVAWRATS